MTGQVALFDLDGTLTNPELGITSCIAHALEGLGVSAPPRSHLRDWIGAPLKQQFADFLGSDDLAGEALSLYRQRFSKTGLFENDPYPGIEAALADINDRVQRSIVVTSKPTVYAQQIVEHFELDRFFDAVHGSELDGRNADKVDLLREVIATHALHPASATMIGDRRFDVRAAKRHGAASVGVLWGFGNRRELEEAGADSICTDIAALPACLTRSRG